MDKIKLLKLKMQKTHGDKWLISCDGIIAKMRVDDELQE